MPVRLFSVHRPMTAVLARMSARKSVVRRVLLVIDVVTLTAVVVFAATGRLSTHTTASQGATPPPTPTVILTQVPGLPPSATCPVVYKDVATPFSAGARGTPMTSCPFVEQVRRAYSLQNPKGTGTQTVRAVSPTTHKEYGMICTAQGAYATCVGGQGAIVYLYHG